MFGIEIVQDGITKEPDFATAERIYYRCLNDGLSFKISAGNVLTLSPPMTISSRDLETALTIVETAITAEAGTG